MEWWGFHEQQSIYEMAEGGRTSLYVGDLEPTVTDSELFDAFSHESHVSSVRVCRDLTTGTSLGYGYVTFDYPQEAKRALEMLNFTTIKEKEIRVMYYVHNPSLRKRDVGNIFIKNLEESIDDKTLYQTFSCFGSILRFKVATNASGQSKGFGFVQYDTEESAQKAVDYMKGILLNEKEVYVGHFLQRDSSIEKAMFTDIYVKNFSESLTDEELNTVFQEFGPTTSCVIIRDGEVPQGKSKGYGFINFESPEDAEKAVEALNGKKFEDKEEWFVTKSKKKYRKESELRRGLKEALNRSQCSNNLCVKNLGKNITAEILKEHFSRYGTITSCKMLGENLYPMVEKMETESAAKITGMILEMDQTKVLHLLESIGALESKVAEAMEILRTVKEQKQKQKQPGGVAESPAQHSVSKSANESNSSLSPSFRSPKPSSLARGNKLLSTRERPYVMLTNRFDSLKENDEDACTDVNL